MISASLDYTRIQRTLSRILPPEEAKRFESLPGDEHAGTYLHEADVLLLGHVLKQAGVTLKACTDRSIDDELLYWDREHLVDLADNIRIFTQFPDRKEKLKYLIEHSIRGDLVDRLSSGDAAKYRGDKFVQYNGFVVEDLDRRGFNVRRWMSQKPRIHHHTSWNDRNSFALEFIRWRRDFRSDYAIGNRSQCCIAIKDDAHQLKFKEILLDYMLDMSVQVVHITRFSDDDAQQHGRSIGQLYLLPMINHGVIKRSRRVGEDPNELFLAVTSVEIEPTYRKDPDIVAPILEAVVTRQTPEGYARNFGLPYSVFSQRFAVLNPYFREKRSSLDLTDQYIRQWQHIYRQQRKMRVAGHTMEQRIEAAKEDLSYVRQLRDQIPSTIKLEVEKPGVIAARNAGVPYLGTNYLDILDFSGKNEEDAFFRPGQQLRAEGYVFSDASYITPLERTLASMANKYPAKRPKLLQAAS